MRTSSQRCPLSSTRTCSYEHTETFLSHTYTQLKKPPLTFRPIVGALELSITPCPFRPTVGILELSITPCPFRPTVGALELLATGFLPDCSLTSKPLSHCLTFIAVAEQQTILQSLTRAGFRGCTFSRRTQEGELGRSEGQEFQFCSQPAQRGDNQHALCAGLPSRAAQQASDPSSITHHLQLRVGSSAHCHPVLSQGTLQFRPIQAIK